MSESYLVIRLLQHFNTLSWTAKTLSGPTTHPPSQSRLCCGSAVLSWGLITVPHASREHSVYFLSLLNLWKKRASNLSCLPMTNVSAGRIQKRSNTFRSIMLRQFLSWKFSLVLPSSFFFFLRVCFNSCILSQRRMTIFGHVSVSAVCLRAVAVFVQTCFTSVVAQPVCHTDQSHNSNGKQDCGYVPLPNTISSWFHQKLKSQTLIWPVTFCVSSQKYQIRKLKTSWYVFINNRFCLHGF